MPFAQASQFEKKHGIEKEVTTLVWVPKTKIETKDLWSKKDIQRYAKIYTNRLNEKKTKTRMIKANFFNYVLDNWDRLQNNGTVRLLPSEAVTWYKEKDDSIFSNENILNPS